MEENKEDGGMREELKLLMRAQVGTTPLLSTKLIDRTVSVEDAVLNGAIEVLEQARKETPSAYQGHWLDEQMTKMRQKVHVEVLLLAAIQLSKQWGLVATIDTVSIQPPITGKIKMVPSVRTARKDGWYPDVAKPD